MEDVARDVALGDVRPGESAGEERSDSEMSRGSILGLMNLLPLLVKMSSSSSSFVSAIFSLELSAGDGSPIAIADFRAFSCKRRIVGCKWGKSGDSFESQQNEIKSETHV